MRLSLCDKAQQIQKLFGASSLLLFGLLLLFLISPVITSVVAAEDTDSISASARVAVRANTAISLYLDANVVDFNLRPDTNGVFSASSLQLGVRTNSTAGYKIIMSVVKDTNALVSANSVNTAEGHAINSITEDTVGSNFANNTWGYALTDDAPSANTTFKSVPNASTEIGGNANYVIGSEDKYNLSFGVKVDNSLPAGNYTNTVLVSVVANPVAIASLEEMTYMQEMNYQACMDTTVGTEKQLIDLRDGKNYWVAKMKDGNCWMNQNLALDLAPDANGKAAAVTENGKLSTLTSANTDMTGTWDLPANRATETAIPTPTAINYEDVRSWNLGTILMTNPINNVYCTPATPPDDGNTYPTNSSYTAFAGQDIVTVCPQYYKNVADWSDTYVGNGTKSYNEANHTYDAHFLIGNYYQFGAATAGSGIGISSPTSAGTNINDLVNAESSICPKGWMLPKSGQNSAGTPYDYNGSFNHLLIQYGYHNGDITATQGNNLVGAPLYFIRPGEIRPDHGALYTPNVLGLYWSSTVMENNKDAYFFYFYPTTIESSNAYARFNGFSVRCLSAQD